MVHALLITASLSLAAPVPKPADRPIVNVVANTTKIGLHEPIIVKIELRNNSKEAIKLGNQLGAGFNTVLCFARGPGEEEYVKYDLYDQGRKCAIHPTSVLPSSTSISCFEVLFRSNLKPIFDTEGVWKIYFNVVADGFTLRSPVTEITVASVAKPTAVTAELQDMINIFLTAPAPLQPKHIATLTASDRSGNDHIATLLKRSLVLARLVAAEKPGEVTDELIETEKYRKELEALGQELYDFQVARILLDKQDQRASKWVDRLDKSNVNYDMMKRESTELLKK